MAARNTIVPSSPHKRPAGLSDTRVKMQDIQEAKVKVDLSDILEFDRDTITVQFQHFGLIGWPEQLNDLSKNVDSAIGYEEHLYKCQSTQKAGFEPTLKIINSDDPECEEDFCNLPFFYGSASNHKLLNSVVHLLVPSFSYTMDYGPSDPMYQLFDRFPQLQKVTCRIVGPCGDSGDNMIVQLKNDKSLIFNQGSPSNSSPCEVVCSSSKLKVMECKPVKKNNVLEVEIYRGFYQRCANVSNPALIQPQYPSIDSGISTHESAFISAQVSGMIGRALPVCPQSLSVLADFLLKSQDPSVSLILKVGEEELKLDKRAVSELTEREKKLVVMPSQKTVSHLSEAESILNGTKLACLAVLGEQNLTTDGALINATSLGQIANFNQQKTVEEVFRDLQTCKKFALLESRDDQPLNRIKVVKLASQSKLTDEKSDRLTSFFITLLTHLKECNCVDLRSINNSNLLNKLRLKIDKSPYLINRRIVVIGKNNQFGTGALIHRSLVNNGLQISDNQSIQLGAGDLNPVVELVQEVLQDRNISAGQALAYLKPTKKIRILLGPGLMPAGQGVVNPLPNDAQLGFSKLLKLACKGQLQNKVIFNTNLFPNFYVTSQITNLSHHLGFSISDWFVGAEQMLKLSRLEGGDLEASKYIFFDANKVESCFEAFFPIKSKDVSVAIDQLKKLSSMNRLASIQVQVEDLERYLLDLDGAVLAELNTTLNQSNLSQIKVLSSLHTLKIQYKNPGKQPDVALSTLIPKLPHLRGICLVSSKKQSSDLVAKLTENKATEEHNVLVFCGEDNQRKSVRDGIIENMVLRQVINTEDVDKLMLGAQDCVKISLNYIAKVDGVSVISSQLFAIGDKFEFVEISGRCYDGDLDFQDLVEHLIDQHPNVCLRSIRFLKLVSFKGVKAELVESISGGFKLFPNLEVVNCSESDFRPMPPSAPQAGPAVLSPSKYEGNYLRGKVIIVTKDRESLNCINKQVVNYLQDSKDAKYKIPHAVGYVCVRELDKNFCRERRLNQLSSLSGDSLNARVKELIESFTNMHTLDLTGLNCSNWKAVFDSLPETRHETMLIYRDPENLKSLRGEQFIELLSSVIKKGYSYLDLRSHRGFLRDLGYTLSTRSTKNDKPGDGAYNPEEYIKSLIKNLKHLRVKSNREFTIYFSSRPSEASRSPRFITEELSVDNKKEYLQGRYCSSDIHNGKKGEVITLWTATGDQKNYNL